MKKLFVVVMICISSVSFADGFQPELFDVPYVDAIMDDRVIVNEELLIGTNVSKNLYVKGNVSDIQDNGKWSRFQSLSGMEKAIEDQAPIHIESLKAIKRLKNPSYWLYAIENKSAKFDRYLYVEDQGKVNVVKYWKHTKSDKPNGAGILFEQSENKYDISSSTKMALDKLLKDPRKTHFGKTGYLQDQALFIELSKPFASELSSEYPESGEPGPSYSAPYLWGHYFLQNEFMANELYKVNIEKYQAPFKYEELKASLYKSIGEFEAYVGGQVPLRESQIKWLNQVAQDYYILHMHKLEGDVFGYNDILNFYTTDDHKPFMTILLNEKDYYKE